VRYVRKKKKRIRCHRTQKGKGRGADSAIRSREDGDRGKEAQILITRAEEKLESDLLPYYKVPSEGALPFSVDTEGKRHKEKKKKGRRHSSEPPGRKGPAK